MSETKPYWWPTLRDDKWRDRIRADYPEDTAGMDNDAIDDAYSDGWKYVDLWDHLGDARHDYEQLADAFLGLHAAASVFVEELKAFGYGQTSEKALPGSYDALVAALDKARE